MDYLQHAYSRGCKVVCEGGTIFWDFASGRIGVSTVDQPQLSWQNMPVEMLYNQMYVDEIKHFIDAVELGSPSVNPVEDAVLRAASGGGRGTVGCVESVGASMNEAKVIGV
jgi:predicted dehydrogenase